MQEEKQRTVKPAEASVDWKPNAHTIAKTGNQTWDSLVQSEETTAALLTRFPTATRYAVGPQKFLEMAHDACLKSEKC